MSIRFRTILMVLMSLALFFGFLHLFIPGGGLSFERLHIFLFNLCSGGTIVLYYTEDKKHPSARVKAFLALSVCYALLAFFQIYIPAMIISLTLAVIVESIRIQRFSVFPVNFFQSGPVSAKFHQASLLCLSIGLIISTCVILNNEYLKLITLAKLKLNTFFLGFSFPLSLITMSVMFGLMKEDYQKVVIVLKHIGFWFVNLGVIIFFTFILAENLPLQLVITTILFATVVMIFYLFSSRGVEVQQKNFLLSGMAFLLVTAITGIAYIILEFFPQYYQTEISRFILKLHAFASLYGWNLSGLAVICRREDFPIKLHSTQMILFHWIIVMILAPLGLYNRIVAVCAMVAYSCFLYMLFSTQGKQKMRL